MQATFTRSESGISNYHLFYRDKILFFTEGNIGDGSEIADDIFFWETLCGFFIPNIEFKFKGCGSKRDLLKIFEVLNKNTYNNKYFIAMDRDYDFHCQKHIEHPHVLYTFGYSFENDLINIGLYKDSIKMFIRKNKYINDAYEIIDKSLVKFISVVRWLLIADILLHDYGHHIIDKDVKSGNFIIVDKKTQHPALDRKFGLSQLKRRPKMKIFCGSAQKIDVLSACKGKIVLFYLTRLAAYILHTFSVPKASSLEERLKGHFFQSLAACDKHFDEEQLLYYAEQFKRVQNLAS